MGMVNLLLQGLMALGMRLLIQHIKSDEDSAEVEKKIIAAKTPAEVQEVIREELITTIDHEFMTDTEIPKEVVEGLAKANSTEDIVKVLETEAGSKSVIDALGSFLGGIIGLIFGKK